MNPPDYELTIEMLAAALHGLDEPDLPSEQETSFEDRAKHLRESAHHLLSAVAVCLKFLLAKRGAAQIDDFGTFYAINGYVEFHPEPSFNQLLALTEPRKEHREQMIAESLVKHLNSAADLAALLEPHSEITVSGIYMTPEEKLIKAIFGEHLEKPLNLVAQTLISRILSALQVEAPALASEKQANSLEAAARDHVETYARSEEQSMQLTPDEEAAMRRKASAQAAEDRRIDEEMVLSRRHLTSLIQGPSTEDTNRGMDATAEIGKTYLGKVVRIAEFGAFVEIFPGTDGLLHISEISEQRIRNVRDELKENDQVLVKVLAIEGNKIRLSRKAILAEQKLKTTDQLEQEQS